MTARISHGGLTVALLIPSLLLAGCTANRAMTLPQDCPGACRIDITFPAGKDGTPIIPEKQLTTRAKPGGKIEFGLPHTSNRDRVLLVFSEPALVDPQGRELWIVPLRGRTNSFRVRDTENCPAPGCKFMVINLDDPHSQPLDPWIIIER